MLSNFKVKCPNTYTALFITHWDIARTDVSSMKEGQMLMNW